MNWHDVIVWFTPAFAWIALWTQFATLRFFDKNETLFKDVISSGAKDLALSTIETNKLIPALAKLCDAVAEARTLKPAGSAQLISTEDVLTEVDFLPHLAGAEMAMEEKENIERWLRSLQRNASRLWKVGLAHSIAVILVPTSFLFRAAGLKTGLSFVSCFATLLTFVWLVYGSMKYQRDRDSLLASLSANRSAS